MKKQFYTYIHCKPDGTPFYVGKGSGNRAYNLYETKRNTHHINTIKKYGKDNIGIYVFHCNSEEQAFADEVQQILQLSKEGILLCNKTRGGEGSSGVLVTTETRNKLSEKARGKSFNKGRKHSEGFRLKLSAYHIGMSANDETRKKMSDSHKGNKYCLGVKQSDETKEKRRRSLAKTLSSPDKRKSLLERLDAARNNEESKRKKKEKLLALWSDPEWKKKTLAARRDAINKRKSWPQSQ